MTVDRDVRSFARGSGATATASPALLPVHQPGCGSGNSCLRQTLPSAPSDNCGSFASCTLGFDETSTWNSARVNVLTMMAA